MAFYAPDPINSTQLIPGGNTPASGALLFVYSVGTTAKQNSYTDQSASTARTNPIILDSGGNIPGNGEVWIASSAKFVLAPSNDTDPPSAPYWTRDAVPGINNVSALIASSAAGEWVVGSTATFVGVTAFSVGGDQTALYTLGRRIKATVTGGDRFGTVTSSVLTGASTAVGVTLDSSTLNGGLSAVNYGLLSSANGSIPWYQVTSTGVFVEGTVTTGVLIATSTINSPSFVPTGTTAPLSGLYLPAVLNPALSANSTKVIDWTSSAVHITGAGVGGSLSIGVSTATASVLRIPATAGLVARGFANSSNITLIESFTDISTTPDLVRVGDQSGGVIAKGRSASSAPNVNNLNPSEWALWRDTAASTTRFYYNNAGTITSSAAFL